MIKKEDLYKPGCSEISGFGGGYEEACRDMVVAGVNWCLENPEKAKRAEFKGYKNVYGLLMENSPEANELSEAVTSVADGCTGAMHQAAISHVMWIQYHSVEEYANEMLKRGNHEDN